MRRLVHYQYVEELLVGRRVLEVGSGDGSGADYLAERAASVVTIDDDPSALATARGGLRRRNVEFRVARPDQLQHEDDAFDVVLVPELQRWAARGHLVPELRRVLRPDGLALFGISADEHKGGMEYADLLEYLGAFSHVRVLGAIPFSGVTMADFEPEQEIEPVLDCSLVAEDEAPFYYLALCSDAPVRPLGYAVIQLAGSPASADDDELRQAVERTRREADEVRRDAERQVRELKAAAGRAAKEETRRAKALRARIAELEAELTRRGEVDALTADRDDLASRVVELDQQRDEADRVAAELAEVKSKLADAERRVLEAGRKGRQELTRLSSTVRTREDEITRLRRELSAAGPDAGQPSAELSEAARATIAEALEASGESGADIAALAMELQRNRELNARVERERLHADSLQQRLEQAQRGVERDGARVSAAEQAALQARANAETAMVRAEGAERALAELRTAAEQQRQRAEGAERRSDGLLHRIEQDAAELSRLHQRLAELQGLRQADQWRVDELSGRLREAELRPVAQGTQPAEAAPAVDAGGAASADAGGTAAGRDLERARQRVAELERRCDELLSELGEKNQLLRARTRRSGQGDEEQLLADLRARTEQVTRLERRVREAEEELGRARARVESVGAWQQELEELRTRQRQLEELAAGAAAHKAEHDALRSHIQRLTGEQHRLREQRDELEEELVQSRAQAERLAAQLEQAKRELTACGRKLARAEGTLRRLKKE